MKNQRKQTAVKGQYSALIISIAVHLAIILAAGTIVAVTVVQRQEAKFEGRQVARPKMQLKRLQVPVRVQQQRQAPKMTQRVTAQAVTTRSVDFKMPDIAGIGGGVSVDMSGAGFGGSLGFATPQLNLFGLRSQGEKIVFLLDVRDAMMTDGMGGIPAYRIIKQEILRMIGTLPPTALFNVIVWESRGPFQEEAVAFAFSRDLSTATPENIRRVTEWIAPLNEKKDVTGLQTLAWEGHPIHFEILPPIHNRQQNWLPGLSYALQRQVDTVYWLGVNDIQNPITRALLEQARRGRPLPPECIIGFCPTDGGIDWATYPGGEPAWRRHVEAAQRLLDEENARRLARGQPIRVMVNTTEIELVRAMTPGTPLPVQRLGQIERYYYTADDLFRYIQAMQQKYATETRRAARTGLSSQRTITLNVVHFAPVPGATATGPARNIELTTIHELARRTRGGVTQLRGLESIQSSRTQ